MKHLTYLLLFLSMSVNAQTGMVLIERNDLCVEIGGDKKHYVCTPDDLTYDVVERWKTEMKIAGIEFQEPLRKIDQIVYIERDYHYFGEIKDRTIYLNKALEEYPFCKRAAIVQMLFINQGGKVEKQVRPLAISRFNVSEKTDAMFKRQFDNGHIYSYVIKRLKK